MAAKSGRTEEQVLEEAAKAAATMLPLLEKRVAALKAVIAAAQNGAAPPDGQLGAPRGQVREHVDAILQAGGSYREREVGKLIAQRFHVVHNRTAIYAVLRRGLKAARYQRKRRGQWSMAT